MSDYRSLRSTPRCVSFQFLSQCVVGASLEEIEDEEEDAASVASGDLGAALPKEGCYEVIGTVKDKNSRKPDFLKELISVRHVQSRPFLFFLFFQFLKSFSEFENLKIYILCSSILKTLYCSMIRKSKCMNILLNVISLFMTSQKIRTKSMKQCGQFQVHNIFFFKHVCISTGILITNFCTSLYLISVKHFLFKMPTKVVNMMQCRYI